MQNLNEDDSKLLNDVLTRSATDPDFRAQLITNPHKAVKGATGVSLPKDLKIRFVEQPSDIDALIVLPGFITADSELSEAELEAVAGGAAEMNAVCWDTCKTTCDRSCQTTCEVTSVTIAV
jgi:hypothetical protein